jgi:hypothetical protein
MAEISSVEGDAVFYDGLDNRRHDVRLTLGSTLQVHEGETLLATWPLDSVRRVDSPDDQMRVRSTVAPELARLVVADGRLRKAIADRCLGAYREDMGPRAYRRIVFWSVAAAASILLVVIYGVPLVADRLAPLVPRAFETRLGDMVDKQFKTIFDAKACSGEEGQKAFTKLLRTIDGKIGLAETVSGQVVSSKVKNAMALPGGRVYLFDGLLRVAESPDEIAGVLAHELGHVRHRDAMRRMIQVGGTSFLVGLLFGDVTGSGAVIFASRQLIDASYSREAEYEADGVAIETMHALGRPIKPMGELLTRVTGDERKGAPVILSSHPLTGDRMDRFAREDHGASGPPILDFGEWRALKNICASTE